MACPACGCKVHYQFNSEDDFARDDERLERCAACGAVFDIEDAADDEDDARGVPECPVCSARAGEQHHSACSGGRLAKAIASDDVPPGGEPFTVEQREQITEWAREVFNNTLHPLGLTQRVANLVASLGVATCVRSHPHENMSPECERLTVIAREENACASGVLVDGKGQQ